MEGGWERIPITFPVILPTGESTTLKEILKGKPAFLTPVYYRCPGICTIVLNQLFSEGKKLLKEGYSFLILPFSFDPEDIMERAKRKEEGYLTYFQYEGETHFLLLEKEKIPTLTGILNFFYEKEGEEFIHPGVVYGLSPDGEIKGALYGADFTVEDLRYLLLSTYKPLSPKRIPLLFYRYDPSLRHYTVNLPFLLLLSLFLLFSATFSLAFLLWKQKKDFR